MPRPSPWDERAATLRRVSGHLEKIFHELTGGRLRGMVPRVPGAWLPQVAVFERGDRLVVSVDLPGIRREDVEVDIDDRAITIRGERHPTGARADTRAECSYGRFLRSVPLPEGADAGAARAVIRDGVLEITLPLPPKRQPRRLEIEDAGTAARKDTYRNQTAEPANEPHRSETGGSEHDRRERRDWQSEGRLGM
ncbi:MAG TPA: Hsp20/alpha crystallin family protein [Burkholderiales bacterium]